MDDPVKKCRLTPISSPGQMCARSGLRVHSYVLMSNHYHLLLEAPEPKLVAERHRGQL